MATVTRTVMCNAEFAAYVSVDAQRIAPKIISRFDPGSRVEVRMVSEVCYAVKAIASDPRHVFSEEEWSVVALPKNS